MRYLLCNEPSCSVTWFDTVLVLYIMSAIHHRYEILQECRIFLLFRLWSRYFDVSLIVKPVCSDNWEMTVRLHSRIALF